jgi:hypothetical protein
MTLFLGGDQLYARTVDGRFFNMDAPTQPLLVVGEEVSLRPLTATGTEAASRAAGQEER